MNLLKKRDEGSLKDIETIQPGKSLKIKQSKRWKERYKDVFERNTEEKKNEVN